MTNSWKIKQQLKYLERLGESAFIGLDRSPTILNRSYGMSWSVGGWLLMPMINKFGMEKFQKMRERVAA